MENNLINVIFKYKTVNFGKLTEYGFKCDGQIYKYTCRLNESGFEMNVQIDSGGRVSATVTDTNFSEPYTLHLVEGISGGFVGQVRCEYESVLTDIAEKCFDNEIFKSDYAKRLELYVKQTYGDDLEYLWQKFPQNAIWRRKDNRKWYGIIMTVSKRKLGFDSEEAVEILDMRIQSGSMQDLVDNEKYFYGYHMNKKHWFTVILDGSVPFEEICRRLKCSYNLAGIK